MMDAAHIINNVYTKTMMKKHLFIVLALLFSTFANAQGYYTQYNGDEALEREAVTWMKSGTWRNGFNAADAHPSVNAVEFYLQYKKNPDQWNAMFRWLANHNLLTIEKGSYKIPGTALTVSVQDGDNGELSARKSESHYHHIDFQYAVKGTERFGIINHYTSKANCSYKPDVIHYDYDAQKARFYDSDPHEFFIFFPGDWHIAKVKSPAVTDQHIRVIVVKLDYIK